MKQICSIILLLTICMATASAQVNNGIKWNVQQLEVIFRGTHTHLFHKDSTENVMDYDSLSFRFYGDGTYKKYLGSDSSFVGPWSLNNTGDSVVMDDVPFKLILLDADSFTLRGYKLLVVDEAGTIDTSYYYLRLYSADGPVLPVKLLWFTAAYQTSVVKLQWATSSEINNHHFEVLHSTNGTGFKSVGTIAAMGGSGINHYTFNDKGFVSGTNYYRLKQVDVNGQVTLSDIVVVAAWQDKQYPITIYPNPAKDFVTLHTSQQHETLTITISNAAGQKVRNSLLPKNIATMQVKLAGLPTGIYQVAVHDNEKKLLHRSQLVIQ